MSPGPQPDAIAAAIHVRTAAHHLAAIGDKASYWRLLANAERIIGRHDLETIYQQQANRYLPLPTDREIHELRNELWPGGALLACELKLIRAVIKRLPLQ